jgi:hypothetical protein
MAEEKKVAQTIMLPEGRMINHSLFVKEAFDERSTPSYKIEVAFPRGVLDDIHNKMLDFAIEKWGADAEDNVILPIKDGDLMAAKREKAGKPGDAYADMDVLRATTQFNRHGDNDAGGVSVYGEDGEMEIGIANQSEIYRGCMVIVAVTFWGYIDSKTDSPAITLYLKAVQKSGDGERLAAQVDNSKLFKPVGRKPAADNGAARSRRVG